MNTKRWIVIGGTTTALALAPLAAFAGSSGFTDPMSQGGVVVAAATAGPVDPSAAPSTGSGPVDTATVSPASPLTPNAAETAASPVTPQTATSPPSPVSPASPVSATSPSSPQTP